VGRSRLLVGGASRARRGVGSVGAAGGREAEAADTPLGVVREADLAIARGSPRPGAHDRQERLVSLSSAYDACGSGCARREFCRFVSAGAARFRRRSGVGMNLYVSQASAYRGRRDRRVNDDRGGVLRSEQESVNLQERENWIRPQEDPVGDAAASARQSPSDPRELRFGGVVTVQAQATAPSYFLKVIGINSATVKATAVARSETLAAAYGAPHPSQSSIRSRNSPGRPSAPRERSASVRRRRSTWPWSGQAASRSSTSTVQAAGPRSQPSPVGSSTAAAARPAHPSGSTATPAPNSTPPRSKAPWTK
jgi:hypothetical protein